MIQIAICDDDERFCQEEKGLVSRIASDFGIEAWIEIYTNSTKLQDRLQKSNFPDILILDIDMPHVDGYELAEFIRKEKMDILLIFLSCQEHLVFQAFEYQPFRFVRKSCYQLELRLALRKGFELWERKRERCLFLQSGTNGYYLMHREIRYVEMENRKLAYHLKSGEVIKVRMTIKKLEEMLGDERFIRINSGCLINCRYVKNYTSGMVILDRGERLSISRSRWKTVQFLLCKFWENYKEN